MTAVVEQGEMPNDFWSRVDKSGECWLWTAGTTAAGYGELMVNRRMWFAHRLSYAMFVGPLDPDLTIDHLCCERRCVRPSHLEQVTRAENSRRQGARITHCLRGHELPARRMEGVRARRRCRECDRIRYQAGKARKPKEVVHMVALDGRGY